MSTDDDFEVAKSVSDLLRPVSTERQVRILRWVSESLGVVNPIEPRTGAAHSVRSTADGTFHPATPSAVDIKSFITGKDPKSDNQFAAAVAYYYQFEAPQNQRKDSISAEVLQEATRRAGRSRLGDPGRTLRNAKNMGYLDLSEPGEFTINTVGENLVAMTLPGQGRNSVKAARKPSGSKRGKRSMGRKTSRK